MPNKLLKILGCLAGLSACSDSGNSPQSAEPSLLERYVLSSESSVPEGIAFDSATRRFVVGSFNEASITAIEALGNETAIRDADNRAELTGIKVDEPRRRLWVCARNVDGIDNRVWVFDADTGGLLREFFLGAIAVEGNCNDLALNSAGVAYVTDSDNPNIYELEFETGEASLLISDPIFDGIDLGDRRLGLNGIALFEDESRLIVGRFAPPSLFLVSLPNADRVNEIALAGESLPFPDGIALLAGDVYAVSDQAVSRVRLSDSFTNGTVSIAEGFSGLSTATVAEGNLYVIKSEVTNAALGLPLDLPFEILRVDLSSFD
ncbi:MAG: hypothetical protein AAF098_00415 [Pseudomonadota bacterium]